MGRHRTPSWMDKLLGRERLTFNEYMRSFGVTDKKEFWAVYWLLFFEYPTEFEEMFGVSVEDARLEMEEEADY